MYILYASNFQPPMSVSISYQPYQYPQHLDYYMHKSDKDDRGEQIFWQHKADRVRMKNSRLTRTYTHHGKVTVIVFVRAFLTASHKSENILISIYSYIQMRRFDKLVLLRKSVPWQLTKCVSDFGMSVLCLNNVKQITFRYA